MPGARVLILSASVGTGHLHAADAIEAAFRQSHPEVAIRNIDVLSLGFPIFKYCYGDIYIDVVNYAAEDSGILL